MRSLILIIFLSTTSLIAQPLKTEFTAKVVAVVDGNTLEVVDENDERFTFYLSEVDCPEIGQHLGEEAKAFTTDLILKKKVIIQRKGKDWLGNKLAIVKLKKGTVLHEELLKEGLAWASRKSTSQTASLQSSAQDKSIGIWSMDEPTPPWIFRRQQTMMQAKSR